MSEDDNKPYNKYEQAYNYTNLILDGFFSVSILVLVIILLARGALRYLPCTMRLTLVLFFVMSTCFEIRNISQLVNKIAYSNLKDFPESVVVINSIAIFLYMVTHWMFSAHYLKAALMLRLAFSHHSIQNIALLRRRRNLLIFLDISIYVITIAILIIFTVSGSYFI